MARAHPILAALALASLGLAVPAAAEHPQTASGRTVTFDHKTGNEWWVEVVLGGPDAASVTKVESMDTGGNWVPLTKRSWGAWAASYHIEPGHQVKFRATWTTTVIESCWFSHPAGLEQCATTGFDATFTNVKGNQWWVEAKVTGNQPIGAVHARVACAGEWKPMTLRSWGAWAASFHIPAGSKVDLRATSSSGATDVSAGYIWPAATPTGACTTLPEKFRASFQNVRGNQYWQEVDVVANQRVESVELRIEHGPWRAMAPSSWGSWTLNVDAGIGSIVEFRARTADFQYDHSYRGYTWWPDGPDVHPAEGQVAWDWADGNHQVVLVNTHSLQRIASHHYTVGGEWVAMQVNEDGEWVVAGQSVPAGASVRFRATFEDGSQHLSGLFPWPPFPQDGSWLEYEGRSWGNETDGDRWVSDVEGRLVLEAHEWNISCKVVTHSFDHTTGQTTTETRVLTQRWTPSVAPVVADPTVMVGEATMVLSDVCGGSYTTQTVLGQVPYAFTRPDGTTVQLTAWHGGHEDGSADYEAWWDTRYGVVLRWRNVDTYSFGQFTHTGRLVDTNAPLQ